MAFDYKKFESYSDDELTDFVFKNEISISELKDLGIGRNQRIYIQSKLEQLKSNEINNSQDILFLITVMNNSDEYSDEVREIAHQKTIDIIHEITKVSELNEIFQSCNNSKIKDEIDKQILSINAKTAEEERRNQEEERQRRELDSFLERLKDETLSGALIRSKKNKGEISKEVILNYISEEKLNAVLDYPNKVRTPPKENLPKASEINNNAKQIFFWGSPKSGKTCTVASLLSTAESDFSYRPINGIGNNYANVLKSIFTVTPEEPYVFLPGRNPFDLNVYMPFEIKKSGEKNYRYISLIDLSGEIFEAIYYKTNNLPLHAEKEENLNNLSELLSTPNKKAHFFFIDYSVGNKPDSLGMRPTDYLNAAANYFQTNNIFKHTTDNLYLVLTKADLIPGLTNQSQRKAYAEDFFNKAPYRSFKDSLENYCKQFSINQNGKIIIEASSIGNVYFEEICDFDNTSAKSLIEILLEITKPEKNSLWSRIINFLNG